MPIAIVLCACYTTSVLTRRVSVTAMVRTNAPLRLITWLLAVPMLLAVSGCNWTGLAEASYFYNKGTDLLWAEDYDGAVKEYTRTLLVDLDPQASATMDRAVSSDQTPSRSATSTIEIRSRNRCEFLSAQNSRSSW